MSGSYSPYSRRGYPEDHPYYTPSPTPSPRHSSYMYSQPPPYPQRPATRAHFRTSSSAFVETSSRPTVASPRYTSDGHYATKTDAQGAYAAGFHTEHAYDDMRLPRQQTKRRSSMSTPQRPSTTRPSSSHKPAALKVRAATDADRMKHKIPLGYSMKNWDPSEPPILLLGSVFDANSLGKWIYDWTTYHVGPASAISEMAGELWLLLIQFSGKLKGAEDVVAKVRDPKKAEVLEDFIEAGARLSERLSELLKACEAPMLRASKKNGTSLGKNAGVEFVETLFGRDRELERTRRFIQAMELFIKRFNANCDEIVKHPTR